VCEGSKAKELYIYHTPGALVVRVSMIGYRRGRRAETMFGPDPGEEPSVKTTILEDHAMAK